MSGAACLKKRWATLPLPTMAFEFNETTGTTLYDTAPGATQTAELVTGTSLVDLGGGKRGVEFSGTQTLPITPNGTSIYATSDAPFSVEARVYLDDFVGDIYPQILSLKSNLASPFALAFSNQSGYYGVVAGAQANWARIGTQYTVAEANALAGRLVHVVISYNGNGPTTRTNFNIYVDNVKTPLATPNSFATETNLTRFGSPSEVGRTTEQWDGKQGFIRVYNTELSQAQVSALFNAAGA